MHFPRPLKILIYIIGLVATLIIVVATAVVLLVDPNDYRTDIQSWVKTRTGQDLSIEGDMKLSLFPWIGVELGAVTLHNPPGFADGRPLAHIGGAAVKARLLPLLSGELQVSRITLQGLELNLETDEQGRTNWEALAAAETPPPKATAPEKGTLPPSLGALAIGGIALENATLRWSDRSSDQHYVFDEISLETGPITLQQPFDLSGRFHLSSSQPALEGRVNFGGKLTLDPQQQDYRAQQFRIEAALQGPILPRAKTRIVLRSNLHANLAAQQLAMEDLEAQLDEAFTLKGELRVTNFSRPALRFTADLDQLDLDRYLTTTEETTAPPASPGGAATAGALALPMESLRSLDLQGRLAIGSLRVSGLHISDLAATIKARNGVIRLKPLSAKLYEGRYQGDMLLDARGEAPLFTVHERLEGVQTGPLLKDYMGNDILVARGDAEIRLRSGGQTLEEVQRRLKGTVTLTFRDGALKGINLARLIREVMAVAKGEPLPADDQPKATDFTDLQATLHIAGNRVRNDDLRMNSPFLRVAGKGEADLLQRRIDYLLQARLVRSDSGQGGKTLEELKGLDIPIRISGNLDNPKFQVDKTFISRVLRRKVEKKIKKKLEKQLQKEQDELGQELQQQLKDTFKKLF